MGRRLQQKEARDVATAAMERMQRMGRSSGPRSNLAAAFQFTGPALIKGINLARASTKCRMNHFGDSIAPFRVQDGP